MSWDQWLFYEIGIFSTMAFGGKAIYRVTKWVRQHA